MDLATLQRFCAGPDGRKDLTGPLTDGKDTYASDNALLVRWRGVLAGARRDLTLAARCARCIADAAAGPAWFVPILPQGVEAEIPCPACYSASNCYKCGGTKRIPNRTPVVVGGPSYQAQYLARLLTLPGLEMAPDPARPCSATPLRFEGGDGAIMPMRT